MNIWKEWEKVCGTFIESDKKDFLDISINYYHCKIEHIYFKEKQNLWGL